MKFSIAKLSSPSKLKIMTTICFIFGQNFSKLKFVLLIPVSRLTYCFEDAE